MRASWAPSDGYVQNLAHSASHQMERLQFDWVTTLYRPGWADSELLFSELYPGLRALLYWLYTVYDISKTEGEQQRNKTSVGSFHLFGRSGKLWRLQYRSDTSTWCFQLKQQADKLADPKYFWKSKTTSHSPSFWAPCMEDETFHAERSRGW